MYKKLFALLAVAFLISGLALSACGGGSTPTPTPVVEEVDPSDANDEPFDYWDGEATNISIFIFPVYEIVGNRYIHICNIGLLESFKFTGPLRGDNLYVVEKSTECSGWVDFSWGKYLVE